MREPATVFAKLWQAHAIWGMGQGVTLIHVERHIPGRRPPAHRHSTLCRLLTRAVLFARMIEARLWIYDLEQRT
jgi:hypothetical protein